MRPHNGTALRFASGILIIAGLACVFAVCFAGESTTKQSRDARPTADKQNGNNKCYVCHPSLKTEDITTAHLDAGITCDECHGASTEHMHDEMLMTQPDLLFGRKEVQKMCSDPSCHPPGGDRTAYGFEDHKDPPKVHAFYKEWLGRTRPNGRTVSADSVCTDCHGTHNLDKATKTQPEDAESADWVQLFNRRDLTGWQKSGDASWAVQSGRITAGLDPNGRGGDILTEAPFEDYLLAVTFRADWPIHAGIWLHNCESEPGPRIEILDGQELTAYTGSLSVPGKGIVLANLRSDLVDRQSYNTISVRVEGGKVQVWLNGEEIGAVRVPGPAEGRIGLHLEKHPASETGQLAVREVLVQRLRKSQQSNASAIP